MPPFPAFLGTSTKREEKREKPAWFTSDVGRTVPRYPEGDADEDSGIESSQGRQKLHGTCHDPLQERHATSSKSESNMKKSNTHIELNNSETSMNKSTGMNLITHSDRVRNHSRDKILDSWGEGGGNLTLPREYQQEPSREITNRYFVLKLLKLWRQVKILVASKGRRDEGTRRWNVED